MKKLKIAFGRTQIAFIIIGISIPLVLCKIPMNHIYGVRFSKSYESEDNWYEINITGRTLQEVF